MPSHIIGIDLGTTNSALSFLSAEGDEARAEMFEIAQVVNAGEIASQRLLPSFLYVPGPSEFVEGALSLPWRTDSTYVVGEFAQRRGVENAGRLVASAKSWLSSRNSDPTQPMLPAAAPEGVVRVSALEVSRQYLEHLRAAWDHKHPNEPFRDQRIFITVPASFDASARQLTQQAAELAGYPKVTLLEEPQAAFYAWIERNPNWREIVQPGHLILVVDVGGGTTDFTLIAVTEENGDLQLERIAVGEHILLGGDNMDLALARYVEHQLSESKTKIDAIQFHSLWQQCRAAKEVLLADNGPEEVAITLLGRGTGLIGGSIRTRLTRQEASNILVEGFFPNVASDAAPQRQRRAALMEVGLPYASDAAITKHLASFLQQAAKNAGASGIAIPTHLLLNGGVLQGAAIEHRLFEVLNGWLQQKGAQPIVSLQNQETKQRDLMHAVARGAAYYGRARSSGHGVRIRGGVPRTYYVGIESTMPAVPGVPAPMKALAVVPFGLEEGSHVELPQRRFALVVGEQAEFRFFSSLTRKEDQPGTLIDEIGDDFEELAPIEVLLPREQENEAGEEVVPVTLESNVTETGMMELWCVAVDGRRWKLEFNVRERAA